MDYTSIKVGQLPSAAIAGDNFIPHEVEGLLKKSTITDLAAFISANGAVGFRAVSVPNGGTLPSTTQQEFILVGPGTYNNVGGGSPVTVTEELNALVSNGTFWFIGVQIPIEAAAGGTANWGGITGTLSAQTDLQNALDAKQPSSADLSSIAGLTGTSGLLRKTAANTYALDTNSYVLASALSAYLPLTGGTLESSGSSNTLNINHSSGSGIALNISKNGNGEGLTIVKGSGSGNAMSVTGGLTSLVNLSLSTVANATGDFLTHSGSTINKRTPAQVLSDIGGQAALTNPITGTGTTNRLPKFTGATSIGNSNITDNGTIVSIETNATINSIPIGRGANGNIFSVSFGYESLIANTTGVSNTAIGAFTLFSNTTGDYNSAFGYSSLRNNTTGDYNSAFGYQALNENTTGSYNSAFGWYALGNNTTGSSNVGIGQYAGLFIENSSTPNSTSSNSVFIGVGTKALADAQTNQIVIGHNAIGAGSNTVTLGNSSIVTTILRGNVGIGTTSPSDKLSIGNGTESINVRVTGNNSGSASGSSINVGISGVTNISIGNKSAILGGSYDSTSLVFWGNGANLAFSNGSDRMIITNGGNVGINQTNPTQKLDVNGLINSTNGISVGGTGVSIVWTGTQAAYDAIATKSSTTIYFIQ